MFSSDQIFEVSGSMDQLEKVIKFAIDMYGIGKNGITYQITKDGKYCLGWYTEGKWKNFPFDFDPHIVAEIVKQHLEKQDCEDPYSWSDGSSEKGFLMKVIPQTFSSVHDGISEPFYGIVSIEPFMNFYAK